MSYKPDSPFVDVFILSGTQHSRTAPLTAKTLKITPHHAVYVGTGKRIAETFIPASRRACPTYCIGTDGDVAQCIPESFRPVTSSSTVNDNVAITFELANSALTADYPVSDATIEKFIQMVVDICKRYGVAALTYDGTPNGSVTRHNMFAATQCPGPYLQSKLPGIVKEINSRLEEPEMKVYNKLSDVPDSYRPTILKLMQRGALKGYEDPDQSSFLDNVLNIDETYCRVMTTLDKLGLIK